MRYLFLLTLCFPFFAQAASDGKSALDRVVETGELRCSYASYDPMVIVDPNTGKLSGIFYDLINEIGNRAGLTVKWVEEVGYGNINAGFVTGRYDAFCSGLWPSGNRARNTVFSDALYYDPVTVWVRHDDTRFDGDIQKINTPEHTVAVIEGDANVTMANALFPNAKRNAIAQNQTIAELVDQVATGKADAVFNDLITGKLYLDNNPNSIKDASPGKPVFMYPLTVGFNKGEYGLKTLFDTVISEMQDDGTVDKTIHKYMKENAGVFSKAEKEYRAFK